MTEDTGDISQTPQSEKKEPNQSVWYRIKSIPQLVFGRGSQRLSYGSGIQETAKQDTARSSVTESSDSVIVPDSTKLSKTISPNEQPSDQKQAETIELPNFNETIENISREYEAEEQSSESEEVIPISSDLADTDQDKSPKLPSEFKEVVASDKFLEISRDDMPWIENDLERVKLFLVTLNGEPIKNTTTDSEIRQFYLGSCVRGKAIVSAAAKLDSHRSEIVSNLFYTHLSQFLRGNRSIVSVLVGRRSKRLIYKFANKGGQRVHFMRFDDIEDKPVILKIAVYDKADQNTVLKSLTTSSHKRIKYAGRL